MQYLGHTYIKKLFVVYLAVECVLLCTYYQALRVWVGAAEVCRGHAQVSLIARGASLASVISSVRWERTPSSFLLRMGISNAQRVGGGFEESGEFCQDEP